MNQLFYVGVKGVIVFNKKVLLIKRIKPGLTYWDLPGGRVQEGEGFEKTLERELKEELPSLSEFQIGSWLHACRLESELDDGRGLVLFFYLIETMPFEVVLSEEHVGYRWVDCLELDTLLLDDEVKLDSGTYRALQLALS